MDIWGAFLHATNVDAIISIKGWPKIHHWIECLVVLYKTTLGTDETGFWDESSYDKSVSTAWLIDIKWL